MSEFTSFKTIRNMCTNAVFVGTGTLSHVFGLESRIYMVFNFSVHNTWARPLLTVSRPSRKRYPNPAIRNMPDTSPCTLPYALVDAWSSWLYPHHRGSFLINESRIRVSSHTRGNDKFSLLIPVNVSPNTIHCPSLSKVSASLYLLIFCLIHAFLSLEVLAISAAHSSTVDLTLRVISNCSVSLTLRTTGLMIYMIGVFLMCVCVMWREIDTWQATSSQIQFLLPKD